MNEYETITDYDVMRECYVMKSEAKQGKHLQRLGELEYLAIYVLKYGYDAKAHSKLEEIMSEVVLDE